MKRTITWLLGLAVVAGCATATIGSEFNARGLVNLKPGSTTFGEATALLGRGPDRTMTGQSGALGHTWSFIRADASPTGVNSTNRSVTLVFNVDGTFQRVLQLQGIELSPEERTRLFAAATRP